MTQAGLDAWNEQCVTEAIINQRPEGQTVIAVAQTLSTIREADDIIFVGADGTIKEQGSWDELVALDGGFADFVRIQSLTRTSDADVADGAAADAAAAAGVAGDGQQLGDGVEGGEIGGPISPNLSQDGDGPGPGITDGHEDDVTTNNGTAEKDIKNTFNAAARWRIAQAKVDAASRFMHTPAQRNNSGHVDLGLEGGGHSGGGGGDGSMVSSARAAILTVKKIAKFEGMPKDQYARLAYDCDNLLHTVRLNELLRLVI